MIADSQSVTLKRVLLAQPGCIPCEFEQATLARNFLCECVESAAAAIQLIHEKVYDLVLVDMALGESGAMAVIMAVRELNPQARFALLSHSEIEEFFPALRENGILNVISMDDPLEQDLFRVAVDNLLYPERAFGVRRYLRGHMVGETHLVHTRAEKDAAIDSAMRFFRRYRHEESELNDLRLAIEELVNNSIYHAFHGTDGATKYKAGGFHALGDGESITIEYGHNISYLAFSVMDNQGSLDVSRLMAKLERQISLEGLLDESGRGLYLVRMLCDEMIVNVHPGVATQIVLLFANQVMNHPKSLHINVVE